MTFKNLKHNSYSCSATVVESFSRFFFNCSMIGLDPARTNYAGKIPSGLDLPSDVADEKHLGEGVAK